MSGGIIGRRYAKALLKLAGSSKDIELIGSQVQEVAEVYLENVALHAVIHEPKIKKTKKIDVVDELTKKMECSDLVNKYCRYLTSRNRFDMIADISSAYNDLASRKLGKATADLTVAYKLSQKEKSTLQKQLSEYTGKKISLSVSIDESILGGAITSIESLVLDGSIRNKLNLIRESISKGN